MARYYKKEPDTIEAIQWFKHGDHPEVIESRFDDTCGWLKRSTYKHFVKPGDYIIKYDNGEYSVVPRIKFEAEYVKNRSNKSVPD